jgi:hypothetical protein
MSFKFTCKGSISNSVIGNGNRSATVSSASGPFSMVIDKDMTNTIIGDSCTIDYKTVHGGFTIEGKNNRVNFQHLCGELKVNGLVYHLVGQAIKVVGDDVWCDGILINKEIARKLAPTGTTLFIATFDHMKQECAKRIKIERAAKAAKAIEATK